VALQAGWIPPQARFEHAQVGLVSAPDGGRLRTRSGDNVQLSDLLQEAVDRARVVLAELEAPSRFEPGEVDAIAEAVGIGAVKYADLSTARESAYVFDWDRMISFRGNTGPYLQYATARIRSIFRQAGGDADPARRGSRVAVTAAPERALALRLLDFGVIVTGVGETAEPHRLCAYLFDVASLFTAFYEECPVLKAEPESLRASRLALCALTLSVLSTGLGLLRASSGGRARARSDAWTPTGRPSATQYSTGPPTTWTREAGAASSEGGIHDGPQSAFREEPLGGPEDRGRHRDRGRARRRRDRRRRSGHRRSLRRDRRGAGRPHQPVRQRGHHARRGAGRLELIQAGQLLPAGPDDLGAGLQPDLAPGQDARYPARHRVPGHEPVHHLAVR
jgi:hypothetical protein